MAQTTCSIDRCDSGIRARGYCNRHYLRWKRHGDPLAGGPERGLQIPWLVGYVADPQDACVEWPFHVNESGYAEVEFEGRTSKATHVALILSGQPRPSAPGNHALHSCDNPPCVNPRHLRWGTPAENAAERNERGRTAHGSEHYIAKLTEGSVREMRALRGQGWSLRDLADRYGISMATTSQALSGKTWGHVK